MIAETKPNFSDYEYRELEELAEYGDILAMDSDDYRRNDRVYHPIDTVRPDKFAIPREDSPWQHRRM